MAKIDIKSAFRLCPAIPLMAWCDHCLTPSHSSSDCPLFPLTGQPGALPLAQKNNTDPGIGGLLQLQPWKVLPG